MNVKLENIPEELKQRPQWVLWRYVGRGDEKPAKVPLTTEGRFAKVNDPTTWATYEDAVAAVEHIQCEGIGFVFTEDDPYCGVDIDNCRDPETGKLNELGMNATEKLRTYGEASPSCTGIKFFGRASIPQKSGCRFSDPEGALGGVEIYGSSRFFTVTGGILPDSPTVVADCQEELNGVLQWLRDNGWSRESAAHPDDDDVEPSPNPVTADWSDERVIDACRSAANGEKFVRLWDGDLTDYGDDHSRADAALLSRLGFYTGNDPERLDRLFRQSNLFRDKWEREDYRASTIRVALRGMTEFYGSSSKPSDDFTAVESDDGHPALPAGFEPSPGAKEEIDDPYLIARMLLDPDDDHLPAWRYWRDNWCRFSGSAYEPAEGSEVKGLISRVAKKHFDEVNRIARELAKAEGRDDDGKTPKLPKARKVSRSLVNNVLDALRSMVILPSRLESPSWFDGFRPYDAPEAEKLIVTRSQVIDAHGCAIGEPWVIPSTRRLFSTNALPYDFDPAAECPEWLAFLDSIWPTDPESIEALQMWFGYCLLPDTSQHKMAMLIGPKRSGKGTIGRILKSLVGEWNTCAPTLSSLAGEFGAEQLLGRTVAIVGDARLSGRKDSVPILERLLTITGEDAQSVNRKHQRALPNVRLAVRFTLLSNEPPRLHDTSAAIVSRVIMLRFTRTFAGKEDHALTDRLLAELPGLLNWSLKGYAALRKTGRLIQPASGKELIDDLERNASPTLAFVNDACVTGPEWFETTRKLFEAWRTWCFENGNQPGSKGKFCSDLRAAVASLQQAKRGSRGDRKPGYVGIALRPDEGEFEVIDDHSGADVDSELPHFLS